MTYIVNVEWRGESDSNDSKSKVFQLLTFYINQFKVATDTHPFSFHNLQGLQ